MKIKMSQSILAKKVNYETMKILYSSHIKAWGNTHHSNIKHRLQRTAVKMTTSKLPVEFRIISMKI